MKKSAIAIAVAAVMSAPMVAQADITPYAHVQFEVANIDDGTESSTSVTDRERGRIGLKGSHDLGNGMSSFAVAEFDIDGGNRDAEFGGTNITGTGTDINGDPVTVSSTVRNGLRVREVNAGIKGNFGSIEIGTLKSAYKYVGGISYDPFVTTTLEARGNGGMTGTTMGHNGFINNAIGYKNKFGDMSLWLTYSPSEEEYTVRIGGTPTVVEYSGQYSAGLTFSQANFEAFVSMVDNGASVAAVEYDSMKVGGQFRAGPHKISAQYEMSDEAGVEFDTMFIGYQMTMGKNTFVAQIGQTDVDGAPDTADYMAVGAIHKLNNQTSVFVGYRDSDGGATFGEETALSVGLRVII